MAKIVYKEKKFQQKSLDLLLVANRIVEEYAAQGFDLTVRQLYYQLVARDYIPNSQKEYKRLGNLINDARLAGLVDWEAIVDRTRNLRSVSHWGGPEEIIGSAYQSYRIDKWANQPCRIECWVEKDALIDVVARACDPLDIPFFSCRGYTSQSEMWGAGQRLASYIRADQTPIILHLGDHDPSGIDMTRDVIDRLNLFLSQDPKSATVDRLALNWNQVEQYSPPPNPAKVTDTRAKAYIAEFGPASWELDALDPNVIVGVITQAIDRFRDPDLWADAVEAEEEGRQLLQDASNRWPEITSFLQNGGTH